MMTNDNSKSSNNFVCESCEYTTSRQSQYNRHLLTTKHKMMTTDSSKSSKVYLCKSCGKQYKHRQGLSFHKKKCTGNLLVENIKEENKNEMNMLRAQIAILMEQNTKLQENNARTTNITQNNTQNIYITVNNFGKENIKYITDKQICRLISMAPSKTIPKIIQMIHFDPEHPENHNVKMTNKKLKYAQVFTDNGWVTTSRGKAVDDMIQTGYNVAAQKYSDNKDKIKSSKQGQFENFQMRFEDQDAETMRTLKSDVDLSLINGTDKIHKKAAIEDTE